MWLFVCYNNGTTTEEMANELSISEEQAGNVYLDIENKRKMTQKSNLGNL